MAHRFVVCANTLAVLGGLLVSSPSAPLRSRLQAAELVIAEDGAPRLPIIAGSVKEPAEHLKRTLGRIVGSEFPEAEAHPDNAGVYVGIASDFDWLQFPEAPQLGPEGVLLKTDE
jgi:hypothetical protein